jgi:hypothetical protein
MDDSILQAATDERVMKPITADFLRVPVPTPDAVSVRINGHLATCQDMRDHCAFAYNAQATPTVTSMSPAPGSVVKAGDTLTLTGLGLASVGSGQTQVTFGDPSLACEAVTSTETEVLFGTFSSNA